MLKVAVFNLKGGTGKARRRFPWCSYGGPQAPSVADLDGQRTLSFALGMDGQTPTALDWLTTEGLFTPLATQAKPVADSWRYRAVSPEC
jgi:chromosome partitioning protein